MREPKRSKRRDVPILVVAAVVITGFQILSIANIPAIMETPEAPLIPFDDKNVSTATTTETTSSNRDTKTIVLNKASHHGSTSGEDFSYILGVSTGHAGTTSLHRSLKNDCNFLRLTNFEKMAPNETKQGYNFTNATRTSEESCNYTRETIVPFFDQIRNLPRRRILRTYIDVGHFHNRGNILECMARLFDKRIAFLRVRRNRYQIANSFTKALRTPCFKAEPHIETKNGRPTGPNYCPHSQDRVGAVHLPIEDHIWTNLTQFQKFLWYADEIEYRYHQLQYAFPNASYYEMTWSTKEEYVDGLKFMRSSLGCNEAAPIPKAKHHVIHLEGTLNCSFFILQDLDYRRRAGYTKEQEEIVFKQFPQRIDYHDCMENREQLIQAIQVGSRGESVDFADWVLPPRIDSSDMRKGDKK